MNENFEYNKSKKYKKIFCILVGIIVLLFLYFKFIPKGNKINETDSLSENSSNSANMNVNNNATINSGTNNSSYDEDGQFRMTVDDKFYVKDQGTVATGKIERGRINVNDVVKIIDQDGRTKKAVVTKIERFRKFYDMAKAGENVGLLLKDIEKDDIKKGQIIVKEDSNRWKLYKIVKPIRFEWILIGFVFSNLVKIL